MNLLYCFLASFKLIFFLFTFVYFFKLILFLLNYFYFFPTSLKFIFKFFYSFSNFLSFYHLKFFVCLLNLSHQTKLDKSKLVLNNPVNLHQTKLVQTFLKQSCQFMSYKTGQVSTCLNNNLVNLHHLNFYYIT